MGVDVNVTQAQQHSLTKRKWRVPLRVSSPWIYIKLANKVSSSVSQAPNFISTLDWLHQCVLLHRWTALEWYHVLIDCHETWWEVHSFQAAIQSIDYRPHFVKTAVASFTPCTALVLSLQWVLSVSFLNLFLVIRLATTGTSRRLSLDQQCRGSGSVCTPINNQYMHCYECLYLPHRRGLPVTTGHHHYLPSKSSLAPVLRRDLTGPE
jgi:hypothetical protein